MATSLENRVFDLIIIGGGTAALSAVSEALDMGVESIALVEKRGELGGECALNGCVPLHTMATAANICRTLKQQAKQYGIYARDVSIRFEELMAKVDAIIHDAPDNPYEADPRVTRILGEARFISRREIQVGHQVIRGDKIIIATGATPLVPDIEGLADTGFLFYHHATHLQHLPKRMVIIGGGRIGVEFAQIFCALGSRITLIEKANRIVPKEEPEISEALAAVLRQDGVEIRTACDIINVCRDGTQKIVSTSNGETLQVDEILVSAERRGHVAGLNLDQVGVDYNEDGIITDSFMRTTADSIWAIGDVVGPYKYTHIANYEAVVAIQNAFRNSDRQVDYKNVAKVVYTEPAIARIGLSEQEARERYTVVMVMTTPAAAPTRFRVESAGVGFIKIIIDGESDQIVGAHMIAHEAGEIIHIIGLAMQVGLSVSQVTQMVYAYPTKSQLIQKALEPYPREKARLMEMAQSLAQTVDTTV